MPSIFTRIINREIPCYKIAEDENFFAFLDTSPLAKGHTLVVPKKEEDYIFDLDKATYSALFAFAQKVAKAIGAAIPCKRVGIAVIGLEVPHAHIHLIPLHTGTINFSEQKLKLEQAELQAIAAAIQSKLQQV